MRDSESIKYILLPFYNSNFFINFNIYLKFLVPFLVYAIILGTKVSLAYFFEFMIVLITLLILYTTAYIINDSFDVKKDKSIMKRLSLLYYYPNLVVRHYLFFYLAEVVTALSLLTLLCNDLVKFGILLYTSIIVLSLIHTLFFKAKVVTSFLLRIIRMVGLGIFTSLLIFSSSNLIPSNLMTVFILMFFPIYNFRSYLDYLQYKNLKDARLFGIFLHAVYYIVILAYLCYICAPVQVYLNSITILVFVFILYNTILYYASKLMKTLVKRSPIISLLKSLYCEEIEERVREFSEILLNFLIFLILFILPT